jgi:hypothetical protein
MCKLSLGYGMCILFTGLLKQKDTKKMCDTHKNVTKMGMIVKGVYYTVNHSQSIQESMQSIEHLLS